MWLIPLRGASHLNCLSNKKMCLPRPGFTNLENAQVGSAGGRRRRLRIRPPPGNLRPFPVKYTDFGDNSAPGSRALAGAWHARQVRWEAENKGFGAWGEDGVRGRAAGSWKVGIEKVRRGAPGGRPGGARGAWRTGQSRSSEIKKRRQKMGWGKNMPKG